MRQGEYQTGEAGGVGLRGVNLAGSEPFFPVVLVYLALTLARNFFPIRDGIVDVILVGTISFTVLVRPRRWIENGLAVVRTEMPILVMLPIGYAVLLAWAVGSSPSSVLVELLGLGKWFIFFVLGLLVSTSRRVVFPGHLSTMLLAGVALAWAGATYDWGTLFQTGLLSWEGFYSNSIAGVFQLRSVFALFSLALAWQGIRGRPLPVAIVLVALGIIGMVLSGNRKSLLGVILAVALMRPPGTLGTAFRMIRLPVAAMALAALIFSPIGENTLREYGNVNQPRVFLYYGAIQIAMDRFPLGSGPGTFATRSSMENYSDVYADYGFEGKWGFTPGDAELFYGDTFWAPVIGQFGVLGCLLMGLLILAVMRRLRSVDDEFPDVLSRRAVFLILLVLSITSPYLQRTEAALFVFFALGLEYGAHARRLRHAA